jgi:hypothetical protein
VEEVFGIIWEETLEEIRLNEADHHQLYQELLMWAKQLGGQSVSRARAC